MVSERSTADAVLVQRSHAGDTAAFTQLVRRYENAAYATALNLVRSPEDARDIVQDAFVAAYCKLVQLREPERFGGWLRTIVRTRSLEWIRRRRRTTISTDGMDLDQLSVPSEQDTTDLWDAVGVLPEKYREVVLMHYMNDFSYNKIADIMGLPVSTIKGRLQRSRAKLSRLGLIEHISCFNSRYGGQQGWKLSSRFERSLNQLTQKCSSFRDTRESSKGKDKMLLAFMDTKRSLAQNNSQVL